MRITGSQIGPINPVQATKVKKVTETAVTADTRSTDQVMLSAEMETIATAKAVIANAPEVRQDKVNAYKQLIEDGDYVISSDKIADKIISEGRLSKILQK
ncbi:MAG: flagellar biosynthesis anti-sigma factor FlgM [bacterium]